MGQLRQSRATKHAHPRRIRLQERDCWIVEALMKMRFVTTGQLARLLFGGSRSAANKRLRTLLDAGLVQVWVRSLSQENVYSLTRSGMRVLGEEEDRADSYGTSPRGLDGNLDHLLAINQVRIALAVDLTQAGGALSWWRSDWELRAHGREQIIPDALFAIQWGSGEEHAFVLEVDNESRSPKRFVKKMLSYASHTHQGGGLYGVSDFTTLVVGLNIRWIERYRLALNHMGFTGQVWFTTLEVIEEQEILGPIWKPADGDEKYSLRDVGSLPYGKEGRIYETVTVMEG